MRVVKEGTDITAFTNSILGALETRRRYPGGANFLHISASEFEIREASLVKVLVVNINFEAIKAGLRDKGFHRNGTAKLVKKAVNDIVDAMLDATKYSDAQRRVSMVRKRIKKWCEKIDPLKKIVPKKEAG